ncbi:MAG: precorrin-3B C(17)-methyltransferase [Planctomycetes bacterium]|nr:precorrin-3B C(17)-methyltransferase [Planctomycetota bacterium]
MGLVTVVGIGPGHPQGLTAQARQALAEAEAVYGYHRYLDLIAGLFPGKPLHGTGMTRERDRCRQALAAAAAGSRVAMVSSGDAGIYGMAGLLYELSTEYPPTEIVVVPGVSAAMAGAALLGAPLMHDFAVISLSDLLTPWDTIARRLAAAAAADFVLCLYNPASSRRPDHLRRACDLVLEHRAPETVCGWTRRVGRDGEAAGILSLSELRVWQADMFTTVFIGSSATRVVAGKMVTPRGYGDGP